MHAAGSHQVVANANPAAPVARHSGVASAAAAPVMHLVSQRVKFRDTTAKYGPGPQLQLDTGILVDLDTRTILWQKNPHLAHAPASTTKVLSTLVALNNFGPDRVVTITPDALQQEGDETVMGLKAGQQLTVEELLSGMLSVSANDAATALAVDTVGMPTFVAAMNAQVDALGLSDSTFTTPVGLDDPGQLASPYDLAVIASVTYERYELFRELVALHDASLTANAHHPAFSLPNLNQLLDMYPGAVGIKPGYTAAGGGCFIGMAIRDGHRLLSVILGGTKVFSESRAVLDWGFVQEGLPALIPPTPPPPTPSAR